MSKQDQDPLLAKSAANGQPQAPSAPPASHDEDLGTSDLERQAPAGGSAHTDLTGQIPPGGFQPQPRRQVGSENQMLLYAHSQSPYMLEDDDQPGSVVAVKRAFKANYQRTDRAATLISNHWYANIALPLALIFGGVLRTAEQSPTSWINTFGNGILPTVASNGLLVLTATYFFKILANYFHCFESTSELQKWIVKAGYMRQEDQNSLDTSVLTGFVFAMDLAVAFITLPQAAQFFVKTDFLPAVGLLLVSAVLKGIKFKLEQDLNLKRARTIVNHPFTPQHSKMQRGIRFLAYANLLAGFLMTVGGLVSGKGTPTPMALVGFGIFTLGAFLFMFPDRMSGAEALEQSILERSGGVISNFNAVEKGDSWFQVFTRRDIRNEAMTLASQLMISGFVIAATNAKTLSVIPAIGAALVFTVVHHFILNAKYNDNINLIRQLKTHRAHPRKAYTESGAETTVVISGDAKDQSKSTGIYDLVKGSFAWGAATPIPLFGSMARSTAPASLLQTFISCSY